MPDQVPDEVKRDRIERLIEVVQQTRPSAMQSASAASRRYWSRARAGPTRLSAGAAPGGTRLSTSPGRRTGELVPVEIGGATSTTLSGAQLVAAAA